MVHYQYNRLNLPYKGIANKCPYIVWYMGQLGTSPVVTIPFKLAIVLSSLLIMSDIWYAVFPIIHIRSHHKSELKAPFTHYKTRSADVLSNDKI